MVVDGSLEAKDATDQATYYRLGNKNGDTPNNSRATASSYTPNVSWNILSSLQQTKLQAAKLSILQKDNSRLVLLFMLACDASPSRLPN